MPSGTRDEVKEGAMKHLARLLLQRIVGVGLYFLAAGSWGDMRSLTYIALYLVLSLVGAIAMYSGRQETLNAREQTRKSTRGWDRILMPAVVILMFHGIFAVAGLGVRFAWGVMVSARWFYIGIPIYLLASFVSIWAVTENKHFEATSRIQDERDHGVITTGPYRIVRHPGYSSVVIWAIASFFMLGTLAVGMASFAAIAAIWIRTYLEDKMLMDELKGYRAYAQQTRHRLIPYIW